MLNMLKSRVWIIVAIVILALVALAIGVGIYFFTQAQQSVIV